MLSVSLATRPVIMAAFADGMRDRGYVEGAITSAGRMGPLSTGIAMPPTERIVALRLGATV